MPAMPTLRPPCSRDLGGERHVALDAVARDAEGHRHARLRVGLRGDLGRRADRLAVDRDDAIARLNARRAPRACRGAPRRSAARPRSARNPSGGMKLPSQSAPASDASDNVAPSRARRRAARRRSRRRVAPGRSQQPPAQVLPAARPARRRPRRRDRRRGCRRAAAGVLGGGSASSARCPGMPATKVPANSSTASSRLAIGPAATIAMRLPDALPIERARQVAGSDRAFALVEPSSRSRRAGSPRSPTRCGRGRSGATRRRARSRPRSAAP